MAVPRGRPSPKSAMRGASVSPKPDTVQLPFMPPKEVDYAEGFRKLASIHLKAKREGVSKELALKRAHLLFSVGNPLGAAFDCERALRVDPMCPEAHFLKGLSLLAMAGVKEGLVAPGPGAYMPNNVLPPRRDLLWAAYCCFEKALMCNPHDQQSKKARRATVAMMQRLANERLPPPQAPADVSKEAQEPLSRIRRGT